ncbi:MAG TPA: alkyl sulfatase dimerization domain-containing protein [Streptosporangiaceae bacterium]|nr:alkyl sulfatase dimerization domain-containing protein [Streptosporangiaceae bacterium]
MSGKAEPIGADFSDRADFADADRGFIGTLEPMVIKAADGRVVWDMDSWGFLRGECPDTVNASLWRQAQLTARHGLYEVTDGIYQVRGFDLSNMTLVESDRGVIVIDPLVSQETAAAAIAVYRRHRGDRAVTAVIYTHSHLDHFGGVLGVVQAGTDVPIIAPDHFLENAVSENVYAGTAMLRRGYYYGAVTAPRSPAGTLGMGLGPGASTGLTGLIAPTLDITATGQEEIIDGVRIVFQITPGTEAPAEMNFCFPDKRALCLAENATRNLHNLLTLRGAQVRDPRIWSRYLAEAIELFARQCDVAFASHHWPTWGTGEIVTYLAQQRDLYAYLHDQTLRLINQGYTGTEIAEMIEMPPELGRAWHTRGYYGSVSHNVKAVYQRYLGWYDGNPAHLWQHPPGAAADRYVRALGGLDAAIAKAREFAGTGDLRFAAELASHAVFADPSSEPAKALLADVLTRLGYGSECATWRNNYLTGAQELHGAITATGVSAAGMAAALTITQLFDSLAIRIDGKRAWDTTASIRWHFTDTGETYRMELSNGALVHHPTTRTEPADLTVTLTRPQLLAMLGGAGSGGVQFDGDPKTFAIIAGLTDQPDPDFAIVTP